MSQKVLDLEGLKYYNNLSNNKINDTLEESKNYTDTEIANLVGTAPETLNTLEEVAKAIEEHQDVTDALNAAIGNKVNKEEGKGLSTNDYTTEEKEKLAGIEEGANNYTLPTATDSVLGGVKIGDNITNTEGIISVNEENISDALGFTPIADMEVASGTKAVATNSAEGFVTDFKSVAKIEQKQYSGKNLLNNTATTQTVSGVTFTVNADKSVTAKGTATADIGFTIGTKMLDAGISYILSGCPSGGSTSTYYLRYIGFTYDVGNGSTIKYDANFTMPVEIGIKSGVTINATFYPMLRLASVTDATYEPYTGGTPAPNPSYPQAIYNSGDCVELEIGGINGTTGTEDTNSKRIKTKSIPCKSGDVIKVVTEKTWGMIRAYFFNDNGYVSYANGSGTALQTTAPANATYFKVGVGELDDITPSTVGKIELTINGKYVLQVKSCNKNLYPLENEPFTLVKSTARTKTINFTPLKNGTYTISVKASNTNLGGKTAGIHISNGAGTLKTVVIRGNEVASTTFTADGASQLFFFIDNTAADAATVTISDIQIEYGDTATDYVPHAESISTILLDEPLRAVNDVKDIIEYVNDGYKVRRKIAEEIFDGSADEPISLQSINASDIANFLIFLSANSIDKTQLICNRLLFQNSSIADTTTEGIYNSTSGVYIRIKKERASTVDEFRAWLAENPITVQYELAEEVIEEIADQTPFYQIQTYDGGTTISTTDRLQPEITVEYPTSRTSGVASEGYVKSRITSNTLDNNLEDVTELTNRVSTVETKVTTLETTVTNKANKSFVTATTGTNSEWYRIASTGKNINVNTGIFKVVASVAGVHSSFIFTASTCYGVTYNTNVQVLQCSQFTETAPAFSKIRIVYHQTYANNYAYIEIYKPNNTTAINYNITMIEGTGWSLITPIAGSIPSGYSNKVTELKSNSIIAEKFVGSLEGSATKLSNTVAIGSATQPVYFNASGVPVATTHSLNAGTYNATITSGFADAYRTQIKGSSGQGSFVSVFRPSTSIATYAPTYSSAIGWGHGDTHGYLMTQYGAAHAWIGGGNADKLSWVKEIAFTDHTHNYLPLSGGTMTGDITYEDIENERNWNINVNGITGDGNQVLDGFESVNASSVSGEFYGTLYGDVEGNASTANTINNTLPVSKGGTGVTFLTHGQALIGGGSGSVTTRNIDDSPTSSSNSLITSGGVYTALSNFRNWTQFLVKKILVNAVQMDIVVLLNGNLRLCYIGINVVNAYANGKGGSASEADGDTILTGIPDCVEITDGIGQTVSLIPTYAALTSVYGVDDNNTLNILYHYPTKKITFSGKVKENYYGYLIYPY